MMGVSCLLSKRINGGEHEWDDAFLSSVLARMVSLCEDATTTIYYTGTIKVWSDRQRNARERNANVQILQIALLGDLPL